MSGGKPASGLPARGYRWPTATPGNFIAEKHGAYSPRRLDPLAAELVEAAVEHSPYLAEAIYQGELAAWSRAEARCLLLAAYIDQYGPLDGEGVPRPALAALTQQERLAGELRHRLGLTPLSRAKLGRDVAAGSVDFAALLASLDAEERP